MLAIARINIYVNLMCLVLIEYQLIQQLNLTWRKIDVNYFRQSLQRKLRVRRTFAILSSLKNNPQRLYLYRFLFFLSKTEIKYKYSRIHVTLSALYFGHEPLSRTAIQFISMRLSWAHWVETVSKVHTSNANIYVSLFVSAMALKT